jgi:hypothetical protein
MIESDCKCGTPHFATAKDFLDWAMGEWVENPHAQLPAHILETEEK